MDKLLTKKDLAARWQVTPKAIENWIKDGALSPCKVPGNIRFSEQYIAELEGVKLEKFSPLERRRLERELKQVTEERDQLRNIINQMNMVMAKAMYQQVKEA